MASIRSPAARPERISTSFWVVKPVSTATGMASTATRAMKDGAPWPCSAAVSISMRTTSGLTASPFFSTAASSLLHHPVEVGVLDPGVIDYGNTDGLLLHRVLGSGQRLWSLQPQEGITKNDMKGLPEAPADHDKGDGRLTRQKMLRDNRFATAGLTEYYGSNA